MLLAINWADFGVKAAQLLLSLSILIIFHEFGHYITAKWFKCRVEKFYLFFDPWFSIFKKKVGETEYGIGWLPLGGYVKISGMVDESMDKEQLNYYDCRCYSECFTRLYYICNDPVCVG